MPSPQVNDRLKEIPAQALRTVFATIGQLLLVADRLRARAVEQLSGSGETSPDRPSDQPGAPAPPPAKPAAQDTGSARWRSLDKTGNVRLLDREDEEDLAATATLVVPEPVAPGPVTQAVPEAAPAQHTPTEVVPAVAALADPAPPEPVAAAPTLPELVPAEPVPAGPVPAGPAASTGASGGALPVPSYDQASVASLRARLRVLDAMQVQVLLDYEKAHEGRPAVITMFERRLTKLGEGG